MFAVTSHSQMTNSMGGSEDVLCNHQGMNAALTLPPRMWTYEIWLNKNPVTFQFSHKNEFEEACEKEKSLNPAPTVTQNDIFPIVRWLRHSFHTVLAPTARYINIRTRMLQFLVFIAVCKKMKGLFVVGFFQALCV